MLMMNVLLMVILLTNEPDEDISRIQYIFMTLVAFCSNVKLIIGDRLVCREHLIICIPR